jgi:hypothetical protein
MDNVDEKSVDRKELDDRQEIITGLIDWLKVVEAHYGAPDNYGTYCKREAIRNLIEEVELCRENTEFPWEIARVAKNISFKLFGERPEGHVDSDG